MPQKKRTKNEPVLDDLIFIGFNRRVVALDRFDGRVIWDWKAPRGTGFVALMLDGDRLIASVNGYTYCLDPLFGQEVWRNDLPGYGTGVPSIISVRGQSNSTGPAAEVARQQAAAAAAAAAG